MLQTCGGYIWQQCGVNRACTSGGFCIISMQSSYYFYLFFFTYFFDLHHDVVVSTVGVISEVNQRRAWLVLGWVIVFRCVNCLGV